MEIKKTTPGKTMREALNASGMKQIDLAEKLGITQASVSNTMNRKKASADVLITMLNAMGFAIIVGKKDGDDFTPMWELEREE